LQSVLHDSRVPIPPSFLSISYLVDYPFYVLFLFYTHSNLDRNYHYHCNHSPRLFETIDEQRFSWSLSMVYIYIPFTITPFYVYARNKDAASPGSSRSCDGVFFSRLWRHGNVMPEAPSFTSRSLSLMTAPFLWWSWSLVIPPFDGIPPPFVTPTPILDSWTFLVLLGGLYWIQVELQWRREEKEPWTACPTLHHLLCDVMRSSATTYLDTYIAHKMKNLHYTSFPLHRDSYSLPLPHGVNIFKDYIALTFLIRTTSFNRPTLLSTAQPRTAQSISTCKSLRRLHHHRAPKAPLHFELPNRQTSPVSPSTTS
jgi:hypothetical protein